MILSGQAREGMIIIRVIEDLKIGVIFINMEGWQRLA